MSSDLKIIYLNNFHAYNGAKFAPFAGYSMPINYKTGIISEHKHVRKKVGIFDVSHMGQILLPFTKSNVDNLEKYIPLNLRKINKYKANYSFLLNNNGGVIDDIIISLIHIDNCDYFYIIYNASRKSIDEKIFLNELQNTQILNKNCLFAIQGPLAYDCISKIINIKSKMKFLDINIVDYENNKIILSRTGYTGEDGFEISLPFSIAENFITKLLKYNDILLCGLGSRNSLRVEAGLSLYGNELNTEITPIQANLQWALDLKRIDSNNLNGNHILKLQIKSKPIISKIGIIADNKVMLRNEMLLLDENSNKLGKITSGCYSPILSKSIGIGYIDSDFNLYNNFYCKIRNNFEKLTYTKLPFVKKSYKKES